MGVGELVYNRVLRRLAPRACGADERSLRTLSWLVDSLMLEHDVRGTHGERGKLKRFHARKGLPYGERWLPPGSYEARNAAWWVPNTIMPRFPKDQPPVLG